MGYILLFLFDGLENGLVAENWLVWRWVCSFVGINCDARRIQPILTKFQGNIEGMEVSKACSGTFSFAKFFEDSPWLKVPSERQAIFIAPLYPRGGLLGGSSDGASKMSKLQVLAAARKKKKAEEQKSQGLSEVEKPMASLRIKEEVSTTKPATGTASSISAGKISSRGFPLRKRKDSNEHEKAPKGPQPKSDPRLSQPELPQDIPTVDQAEPSAFANTVFSSPSQATRPRQDNLFTLTFASDATPTAANPFAGPSPDDIVIAAQSKGSTNSARPRS